MRTVFKIGLIVLAVFVTVLAATTIQAQTSKDQTLSSTIQKATSDDIEANNHFVKKRYSIKGMWSVSQEDGQTIIQFNEDFKTKGGPDLKLYLSSNSLEDLESGTVEASSVKLSVLKSNRGAQSYIIPEDIDLSNYKSVVIHCEAFSVLWGGFNLYL